MQAPLKGRVELKILTPTCVSSGGKLSWGLDAVLIARRPPLMARIDLAKFSKLCIERGQAPDLRRIGRLSARDAERCSSYTCEADPLLLELARPPYVGAVMTSIENLRATLQPLGIRRVDTRYVIEHMKRANMMPYIPGSSVKGLLRTALLYYALKRGLLDPSSTLVAQVRSNIASMVRPRDAVKVATPLEDALRLSTHVRGYQFDLLQCVALSDPLKVHGAKLELRQVLVMERGCSPYLVTSWECLPPEVAFEYELMVRDPRAGVKAPRSRTLSDITSLFAKVFGGDPRRVLMDALMEWSRDLVDHEVTLLRNNFKGCMGDFAEWLLKTAQALWRQGYAVLKIGLFCGHMFKTVDLFLRSSFSDVYDLLCRRMSDLRRGLWDLHTIKVDLWDWYRFRKGQGRLVREVGWIAIKIS